MRKILILLAVATLASCWAPGRAWGQLIDPQISVLGSCGGPLFGNEVNGICNGTSFSLQNHSNKNLSTYMLVILGLPGGGSAPTLAFNGNNYNAGGAGAWGWNGSSSQVTMNSASANACTLLGLNAADCNSESFGNWASADSFVNHFTPTSFGIYAYQLPLPGGSLPGTPPNYSSISAGFTTALPVGSFVIGYSCMNAPSGTAQCTPGGNVGSTPFTVAGLTTTAVPEPATLTLLGSGLLGLAGLVRRQWPRPS